jgi:hypothetical protein
MIPQLIRHNNCDRGGTCNKTKCPASPLPHLAPIAVACSPSSCASRTTIAAAAANGSPSAAASASTCCRVRSGGWVSAAGYWAAATRARTSGASRAAASASALWRSLAGCYLGGWR